MSSKRTLALQTACAQKMKLMGDLIDTMTTEVNAGKEELRGMPSLKLKKWNATRWLGRSICLTALCNAYEYVLDHLSVFMNDTHETAEHRQTAAKLYEEFTSYDKFVFIFLYRDLTAILARTSKLLQARDIQIRDVGRQIMTLCKRLNELYPEDTTTPLALIGEGEADNILSELFEQGLNSIFLIAKTSL
jgi:hypothetical protein